MTGMNAIGLNENLLYVLAKWKNEYVIIAERRMSELQMRTGHAFKKLLTFNGDTLDDIIVSNCLDEKDIPVVINNEITNDFGTGF